jgi:hypothetical protein
LALHWQVELQNPSKARVMILIGEYSENRVRSGGENVDVSFNACDGANVDVSFNACDDANVDVSFNACDGANVDVSFNACDGACDGANVDVSFNACDDANVDVRSVVGTWARMWSRAQLGASTLRNLTSSTLMSCG